MINKKNMIQLGKQITFFKKTQSGKLNKFQKSLFFYENLGD